MSYAVNDADFLNGDREEIEKFDRLAKNWWDPTGPMGMLHVVNPLRMGFIAQGVDVAGRKIIKNKGVFPNHDAVKKSIFWALKNAQKKWTMPIRNWPQALNQFVILFQDRIKL